MGNPRVELSEAIGKLNEVIMQLVDQHHGARQQARHVQGEVATLEAEREILAAEHLSVVSQDVVDIRQHQKLVSLRDQHDVALGMRRAELALNVSFRDGVGRQLAGATELREDFRRRLDALPPTVVPFVHGAGAAQGVRLEVLPTTDP